MTEYELELTNFRGERYVYRQPREEVGVIALKKKRKVARSPRRRTA
jgi:hypothetical protein